MSQTETDAEAMIRRVTAAAARLTAHGRHALAPHVASLAPKLGRVRRATGLLLPLALGTTSLMAGLAALTPPSGIAHVLLVLGVSLTGVGRLSP